MRDHRQHIPSSRRGINGHYTLGLIVATTINIDAYSDALIVLATIVITASGTCAGRPVASEEARPGLCAQRVVCQTRKLVREALGATAANKKSFSRTDLEVGTAELQPAYFSCLRLLQAIDTA